MARAGYDPAALRRYIDRTQPVDSKMSPLPARALRLAGIDEALRKVSPHVSSARGEFTRVQEAVR